MTKTKNLQSLSDTRMIAQWPNDVFAYRLYISWVRRFSSVVSDHYLHRKALL